MVFFYFRVDDQYLDNNFTVEQLRNDICYEILKEENKVLQHFLYFGTDLLDQEDWKDLMIQHNEDSLHCDLVFIHVCMQHNDR